MGSAAAWQCAARGLRVLGLDRFAPPHAFGSHHGDSRVIRETSFEHPRYVPLVRRAWQHWRALGDELLIPSGVLYAGVSGSSVVHGSKKSAVEYGVACEELDAAEIRRRWPAFAPEDGMVGLFERQGGVLRPERCVRAMLEAARSRGAELRMGEAVGSWGTGPYGIWVETDRGRVTAGHLILTTGAWMAELLNSLGAKVWVERVVQHWFRPRSPAARLSPDALPVYLWEDAAGVIFYGFPVIEGALKCAVHHRGEATSADLVRRRVSTEEITHAKDLLARYIPDAAGAHERSAVCVYTNTPDNDFIIDHHPYQNRVVLASPCNGIGFKFAPAVGEILADLVAGAVPRFDLQPFSLGRFAA